jgi:asparagine synthase (glutamine-hydrolysing)
VPFDYVRAAAYEVGRREGARLAIDGHGGDYTVNMLDAGMLGRILSRGHLMRFLRELRARRAFTGRSMIAILYGEVMRPLVPQRLLRVLLDIREFGLPLWQRRMSRDDFALRHIASGTVNPRKLRHRRVAWLRWRERWLYIQRQIAQGPFTPVNQAAQSGLDFTRPYHDVRIVELALAIPEHLQLRDGRERWLARTAFADCLPKSLVERQPGNTPERPGQHTMLAQSVPAALAVLEAEEPVSPATRYVMLSKLRSAVGRGAADPKNVRNHVDLLVAANGLVIARFINWFNRTNRLDHEP